MGRPGTTDHRSTSTISSCGSRSGSSSAAAHRIRAALQLSPISLANPLEIVAGVEGRHVVPRRLRRLCRRGRSVRLEACALCDLAPARRHHLRGRARSACSSAGIANFVNGELWGRPTDVPWAMVFPGGGPLPRHPSQLYEATLEGLVLLRRPGIDGPGFGALKRPGSRSSGRSAVVLCAGAFDVLRSSFANPTSQLGFLFGGHWLTMGMLSSTCPCSCSPGCAFIGVALLRKLGKVIA